jgi:hypothetical protein
MTDAAPEQKLIAHCRSCLAPICWLRTVSGKWMPVNAETAEEGDEVFQHGKHVSHYATCPQGSRWRRK